MNLLDALNILVADETVNIDAITSIKRIADLRELYQFECEYTEDSTNKIFLVVLHPVKKCVMFWDFGYKPELPNVTELDEHLTGNETIEDIEKKIDFQLAMGESKGGTIVSNLVARLESLKNSSK